MLDGNWREVVDRGLMPIGRSLRRTGITADVVTVIGILMAAAASVAIGLGYLRLGFLLLVLTGVPDALDGAVAKAAGTSSSRGAFFDSVADRLTDALLFGGVAWYLAGSRTDRTMMLPVAIMATAMFISYQRAKAESLGYDAKGGLMERAERFIVLAFGLLFAEILIPVLWVMLVLSLATAAQRFAKVWRQASAGRQSPSQLRAERRRQLRAERRKRQGIRRPVRR
ncbi:MAG: CDP-alcohol phosphatidyltransferase family protein [Actinomycetota bacterium]|mgnify:FL=1|jgi:CDP-diacylglycerol--glycerol-3-phosphate 3-phosphatidyltransferase|nr:CDP-alcohol phosphatidyltransferase family protein [Actinomycetota bacterium]MEC9395513.1 CDP-alcohol phosphatidyltransferase family protein [Actinomycetota bacterium]MEC9467221.1 CDP-alcohol phosphatidyltransferase family protein [Actinomycetota bacterium]MED6327536.1 CDP-alcohol phosphatidyltransferase family protein [Actinomycetota bacterium]MEE2957413.1 CDP-alcohol phosphatidyltransferase family protein [Actinomycetota bacterium]